MLSKEPDKKLFFIVGSTIFILFIFAFSIVKVNAIEFNNVTNETIIGETGYIPLMEIAKPFGALFVVQLLIMVWFLYDYALKVNKYGKRL